MKLLLQKLFLFPVRIYQWIISPLLPKSCRYEPSCSNYFIEAVFEWGILKGSVLGIKRIFRCHPWGDSGYDPVPENKKTQGE